MILEKELWVKEDIKEFQRFLKTFENPEKKEWSTNILQTKMPVLSIKTKDMASIINNIKKGNYLSFIDLWIWEYYENTAIIGSLISSIPDFETRKKYLNQYIIKADNWATCDLLKFNVLGNEESYFRLAKEYVTSDLPFVRRCGLYILFDFITNDKYNKQIYNIIDCFTNEEHYYVNMMLGWLLSECFIKDRKQALVYYKNNNLNRIAMNKAVQKCRESRRVTEEDKEMLKQYKK